MRQPTLPGIVQRRFIHCATHHGEPVAALVARIGAPPGDLCRLIAGQQIDALPLATFERIARWLRMPLANVTALAGRAPALAELVRLGMTARGYRPTSTRDQIDAAREAGISVAVFRRALHGYADFRPTIRTCDRLAAWLDAYPIASLEDGLAEDDWHHWRQLRARVGSRAMVMGDDLLCTHPARIRRAVEQGAANALLLKVNQIGTLSEAADACRLAVDAGWRVVISARSGETEDNWLADLAVGWSGHHIKVGAITQSDRLAKYNRLLAIERTTGLPLAR